MISILNFNGVVSMELRNVATFLRVAECESFTKAAEQLGYVQSTVTIQIQQLEAEIGVPLFDRIGKHVSLTSSGQEFMGYATQMMQIAECSLLLGKPPKEMGGVLRLGILESLFNWVLCDQIPQYHRDFPKIILETRMTSGDDLLQMLKHNELDMIFFLGKKTTERDFIRACAHLINIVFVTYLEHPLAGRGPVSLADVVRQPMILPERKAVYRRALEEEAAQKNLYIAPFLEIDNSVSIVSLLKQKLGISFLPEYVVRSSVQKGELVILPAEDCSVQLWSQVFYHKSKWVTPPMDSLIQLIQDRVFQDRFLQR